MRVNDAAGEMIRLEAIPGVDFSDYRYKVIFGAYKWDPQVEDHGTVSSQVVLLCKDMAGQLAAWAEELAAETVRMEEALLRNLNLAKELGLPGRVYRALRRLSGYDPDRHVRLMRFDFHPTTDGWAISEVNSDVPGGLAEASVLPEIAGQYFSGCEPGFHVGERLLEAFRSRRKADDPIAFVHATSYSDDRQVMQFLGDYFANRGIASFYAAPDHLKWSGGNAVSVLEGQKGAVGGIVRFFPLEWLPNLPHGADWQGYYDSSTPSCNHPAAILTQSKRLPIIWDRLGVDIPAWRQLLPETKDPREVSKDDTDWILKPALGRVGEGISIREVMAEKERRMIEKAARRYPKDWVAQRRFESRPLYTPEGEAYHLCMGVFTVDGKCAGFYGRISPFPRIDARAKDIPVLVMREDDDER